MFDSGVDMIIEQVVNPKIQSVFKPAVDVAACRHLNIDPEACNKNIVHARPEFLMSYFSLPVAVGKEAEKPRP